MKKTINVVLLLTIVTTTFAQGFYSSNKGYNNPYNPNNGINRNAQSTNLVLQSASITKDYIVTINNQFSYALRSNNNNSVISNLQFGTYNVTVEKVKTSLFGKQRNEVIYNGSITLRNGYQSTLYINAFDQVIVQNNFVQNNNNYPTPIGTNNYPNNNNGCGNQGNGNGYGKKHHNRQKGNRYGNRDNDD